MHPELLSYLAAERRRDIAASLHATPAPAAGRPRRPRRARAGRPLPSFRVTWSRTTLAAASGRRRGRSVIIVISATRAL
jgi:hypothetical protein